MGTKKMAPTKSRTLYIKNPVAHRLAEKVSRRLGVTLSDAVIVSLEEKLRSTDNSLNRTKIDALSAKIGSLPVRDARTGDEIIGYDDFGLPR